MRDGDERDFQWTPEVEKKLHEGVGEILELDDETKQNCELSIAPVLAIASSVDHSTCIPNGSSNSTARSLFHWYWPHRVFNAALASL